MIDNVRTKSHIESTAFNLACKLLEDYKCLKIACTTGTDGCHVNAIFMLEAPKDDIRFICMAMGKRNNQPHSLLTIKDAVAKPTGDHNEVEFIEIGRQLTMKEGVKRVRFIAKTIRDMGMRGVPIDLGR